MIDLDPYTTIIPRLIQNRSVQHHRPSFQRHCCSSPILFFFVVGWVIPTSCWIEGFAYGSSAFINQQCLSSTVGRSNGAQLWRLASSSSSNSNDDRRDLEEQALEAIQSLVEFHSGIWHCVDGAQSWTVTADIAAGIVQHKTSPPYDVYVQYGVIQHHQQEYRNNNRSIRKNQPNQFQVTETFQWDQNTTKETVPFLSARTLALSECNVDVDVVDASYSLDVTLPDFPPALAGTGGTDKLKQFMVEHCLATSDDSRARLWAIYGPDQSLLRVVVAEEQRVQQQQQQQQRDPSSQQVHNAVNDAASTSSAPASSLTAQDLRDLQSDIDRLVNHIVSGTSADKAISHNDKNMFGQIGQDDGETPSATRATETTPTTKSESSKNSTALVPYVIRLLELCSGVWLGDAVIRDIPSAVSLIHENPNARFHSGSGQGFATAAAAARASSPSRSISFATWTLGVQKVAWRWMWNFGDNIRQVQEVGKAIGVTMLARMASPSDLAGTICVNQRVLSPGTRRIPSNQRMVYVDWNGDCVGFLVGSMSMQIPRYLQFDRTPSKRPFYTEFCVYQCEVAECKGSLSSLSPVDEGHPYALPNIICSRMTRVYNDHGQLKQGITAFFKLQRFGTDA